MAGRLERKSLFFKLLLGRVAFSLLLSSIVMLSPVSVDAGILSKLNDLFTGKAKAEQGNDNSQNMQLLQAATSPNPDYAKGGVDIAIVDDSALLPDTGPIGTQADITEDSSNGQISIYVVHQGDSLGAIAKMFGVSVNTIVWANNIQNGSISPGQKLIILPVSGIQYVVKKGDTVASIAKKYKADVGEILTFNGLSVDAVLAAGDTIIIPDGELAPVPTSKPSSTGARGIAGVPEYSGYYIRPISTSEGRKTQGLHGYNGIDIGAALGTPIRAAAAGTIIIARSSGWNGGYGQYIVIKHGNGTQTLYSHMNAVAASEGMSVVQGQIIGFVGSTGRSTGPHLHFEVRGAKNSF